MARHVTTLSRTATSLRVAAATAALALLAFASVPATAQDFTTLKGHGGPVMGLAVSPAGRVASASFDNSVGLWQGREPTWLEAHDAAVVDVIFPSDGVIASGGDDFAVRLWQDGAPRLLGRHKGKVTDLALSPDGQTIASASWDGTVALWPLSGGQARWLTELGGGVNDVAFAPDGRHLYAATSAGDLLLFDLTRDDPPRALSQNGFGINEIVLAPDGSWLAYGMVNGTTWVIDPLTGDKLRDFAVERKPVLAMAHHAATGQLAIGYGDGYIITIDTNAWRLSKGFQAMRDGPAWALAWTPDGEMIWAGGIDNVIYGWPVALFGKVEPPDSASRSFLRDAASMPNGERQFMRKCSICHALEPGESRKAGPTLYGIFGREAGTLPGYRYSETLLAANIVWTEDTIDALFDQGPDHFIPRSKMPMQRITRAEDRDDLIAFLKRATE
ncbi:c-type cytochrome [Marimonas arenosa]|uniref:C-type cytochrome n=1 Tax=Marimonas arenosa TaxID=1795305 RepID=A0AAE3W9K1_9RHOB|nr:c-type cytochrome [Marimonas arenosa]MDQ2088403.1 c-type cytochrome [Marimonas arenosa]